MRRGWRIDTIAELYETGSQEMIRNSHSIPNYHIIKYEDIVNEPLSSLTRIYELAGLNLSEVGKIRLSDKPVIGEDGKHVKVVETRGLKRSNSESSGVSKVFWYSIDEFGNHFRRDANDNQISLLANWQKEMILEYCRNSLECLGYV